jgi:hypothetical protein
VWWLLRARACVRGSRGEASARVHGVTPASAAG